MTKRTWLTTAALVAVVVVVGAACTSSSTTTQPSGSGGGTDPCKAKFGCVTIRPGDPLHIGAIQSITGATATLGQPQVNGIYAAIDYLDGKFDGIPVKLMGHTVTLNDGGPYTQGLTAGFAKFFKELGGTITADEAFDPTVTDFKPVLTSVAQGHPGMIYFPDFNPPCALISQQAKQIPDLAGVQLVGSDGCNDAT